MASGPDPTSEWLVQGDAVATGSLLDHIESDSGVKQLQRIAQDTVVLSMSPTTAARLRRTFRPHLVVEPNSDLPPPT